MGAPQRLPDRDTPRYFLFLTLLKHDTTKLIEVLVMLTGPLVNWQYVALWGIKLHAPSYCLLFQLL